ncbi:MAG TPA: excalibur calcium-binding domain-containing protein [Pedococcus sp.]|nr:excalibur calcium-binding domain-containing protein [Pedococcus sp.]
MISRIILALCAALALTACSDTGAPSAPTTTVTPPLTTTMPTTTTTTTTITTTTTVSRPLPPAAPANTPEVNVPDAPAPAYYANCDAARRAGAAPIRRGEPGYRRDLDRDGDGIACDK